MRIVIELKKDANPQVVLNRLFAQTALQSSFSVNMLALVDDQSQPRCLTLRNVLDEYLGFQEQVIIRRTQYELKKAEERAHILEVNSSASVTVKTNAMTPRLLRMPLSRASVRFAENR